MRERQILGVCIIEREREKDIDSESVLLRKRVEEGEVKAVLSLEHMFSLLSVFQIRENRTKIGLRRK